MRKHKEIVHDKVRPFQCSYCGKGFGGKSAFESHVNGIHLKEKFFECHICHKNFRFSSNLSRHLKTQHVSGETAPIARPDKSSLPDEVSQVAAEML